MSKNRSRHGPIYHAMRSSRARFKYALRQCRYNERQIASEKLANHMEDHELNDFGKMFENIVNLKLHCLIALTE